MLRNTSVLITSLKYYECHRITHSYHRITHSYHRITHSYHYTLKNYDLHYSLMSSNVTKTRTPTLEHRYEKFCERNDVSSHANIIYVEYSSTTCLLFYSHRMKNHQLDIELYRYLPEQYIDDSILILPTLWTCPIRNFGKLKCNGSESHQ